MLKIFDETFRITYSLQLIALIISGFTILNTVLMLIIEREREFGILHAVGAGSKSLIKMVTAESLLLGLASLISALMLGILLALLLVFVINKFFFAWSVHFEFPVSLLLSTSIGTILLSIFAGLIPGSQIATKINRRVLRYE